MCATCGCSDDASVRVAEPGHLSTHTHDHPHPHGHALGHAHPHEHAHDDGDTARTVTLEVDVLAKNDLLAEHNRTWLRENHITAVNLMSSPGSGKTTLLERTIRELAGQRPISVVEGDQETLLDAERISATGAPVVQINTGAGCHLDAEMLDRSLQRLQPGQGTLLFIENVGNLVCPSLFDLGEETRVVVVSTTEGQDKPLKYPHMIAHADLVLLNKIDLLPYLDFDVNVFRDYANQVNHGITVLPTSATTGEGLDAWYDWLQPTPVA